MNRQRSGSGVLTACVALGLATATRSEITQTGTNALVESPREAIEVNCDPSPSKVPGAKVKSSTRPKGESGTRIPRVNENRRVKSYAVLGT